MSWEKIGLQEMKKECSKLRKQLKDKERVIEDLQRKIRYLEEQKGE